MSNTNRNRFECANPILRVQDMPAALRYYVDVMGFEEVDWGNEDFTCVSRDGASIYLSKGEQGQIGSWVWIGVEDAETLYEEFKLKGARILEGLTNYSWALEFRVQDLDGNVLRIGSDSK